jgi:hypothetical protein
VNAPTRAAPSLADYAAELAQYLATPQGRAEVLATGGVRIPLITTLFGLEGEAAQAVDSAYLAARYARIRAEVEEGERSRLRARSPARSGMDELLSNPDGYGWHEGTRRVSFGGIEMSLALLLRLERELGPKA